MLRRNNILALIYIFPLLLAPSVLLAQRQYTDTLDICPGFNTYLKIKGMDIKTLNIAGNNGIKYQNVSGVIMFMAAKENFAPTNMLVIGADTVLQFYIRYVEHPKKSLYQYNIGQPINRGGSGQLSGSASSISEKSPTDDAEGALAKPVFNAKSFKALKLVKSNVSLGLIKNKMLIRIPVIAQDADNIYFVLSISNNSPINYMIDNVNFEVRSRKTMKTSGQQAVYPSYVEGTDNPKSVNSKKLVVLLFGLTKFALRDDEILTVTVFEKSVSSKGRPFKLDISAHDFNSIIKL